MPRAVFLDRDGTVSEEIGYIGPEAMHKYALIPGAAEGIRALRQAGYLAVLVTNQSGVARGYYAESQVHAVHARLAELLAAQGTALDSVRYCPHHPDPLSAPDNGEMAPGMSRAEPLPELAVDCACRKPKPGMVLDAARSLGIDLAQSWVVGDKAADMGLAANAGCRGILVLTGYGVSTLAKMRAQGREPALVARDLAHAAELILAQDREDAR
jgi:D-glycero-D-manno-heptose 1,7-bisphosphate phosphatase